MKKILYITLALLTLSSCNKWFNVEPNGDGESGGDLFKTESTYRDYLNGIYTILASKNLYGSNLSIGGVEFLGQSMVPDSFMQPWTMMDFNNDASQKMSGQIYAQLYKAIFMCNDFLEQMDKNPSVNFIDGSKQMMRAEATALRAMLHFELLRLFSPAYSADKTATSIAWAANTSSNEKMTTEQLTAKIAAELKVALLDLKLYDPIVTGIDYDTNSLVGTTPAVRQWKFNYYAAQAVMARVQMSIATPASYALALTSLETVIKATVSSSSPEAKFKFITAKPEKDIEMSAEFIFALPSTKFGICAVADELFNTTMVTMATKPTTLEPDDNRNFWFNNGATTILPKFALTSTIVNWNTPPAIPVVKIGEVYLMAAECAAASSVDAGIDYFNQFITNRNSATQKLISGASMTTLKEAISKQYTFEFLGEGVLFHYLKRGNIITASYDKSQTWNNMATRSLNVPK